MANLFCPLYKNKQVFSEFNEIISSLGGSPMTEEEFKSGDLRNQRTGLDYSAMEAAYKIWDQNQGYPIDKASNGEDSILFNDLYKYTKDRNKAIALKADIFSNAFKTKFEGQFDANGEPILFNADKNSKNNYKRQFAKGTPQTIFGEETAKSLHDGKTVSSKDILDNILSNNLLSPANINLGVVMFNHDIDVKYGDLPQGILMQYQYDKGKSVMVINAKEISKGSNQYAATSLVHEMVHSVISLQLTKATTEEGAKLKSLNDELFTIFDKQFDSAAYDRCDSESGYYCLYNAQEFAAEFATNEASRALIMDRAIQMDKEGNKTILGKLKRLINAITNVLINKHVFKNNVDKVNDYQNILHDYLYNNITNFSNEKPSSLLKRVYKAMTQNSVAGDAVHDAYKNLQIRLNHVSMRRILTGKEKENTKTDELSSQQKIDKMSSDIADRLTKRLAAIMISNIDPSEKSKYSQELSMQIQQFNSTQMSKYQSIQNFIQQVEPQLIEDLKQINVLNKANKLTDDTMFQYNMHDNFGAYDAMFKDIRQALNDDAVVELLCKQLQEQDDSQSKNVLENMNRIKANADHCAKITSDAILVMNDIRLRNVKRDLAVAGNECNSPTMAKYIDEIEDAGVSDLGGFVRQFGDLGQVQDDSIRAIVHMVNKAINHADVDTNDRATDLLVLQENLKNGESLADLYEMDNENKTTGYLIRKLNYGKMHKEYDDFLTKLNIKYGLSPDNKLIPDDDEIKQKWSHERNEWLGKHVHRKHLAAYYEAFSKLSSITNESYSLLQNQITSIRNKCLENDGFYHYEKLSKDEWEQLGQLYSQKRQLSSDYYPSGELKVEGTVDYKIAKELQQLTKDLHGDSKRKISLAKDKWQTARRKIIESCGGVEQFNKGRENKDFKWSVLDKWDSRNSKKVFKTNEKGETILFKQIEDEMIKSVGGKPIYDVVTNGVSDNGAAYEANAKAIRSLLSIYRNQYTGEVDASNMPATAKSKLKALQRENSKIARMAKRRKGGEDTKAKAKKYGELFKKYTESIPTNKWLELYRQAAAQDLYIPGALDAFEASTGDYDIDNMGMVNYTRYKWFSKMVARPEYEDQFMELSPGDGWMDNTDDDMLDKDFDESQGQTQVPNAKYYDNSKQYNKIANSKTLKALYDGIYNTIKESNEMQSTRQYYDNYLLPQITGSSFKQLKGIKWKAALDYIKNGRQGGFVHRLLNNEASGAVANTATRGIIANEEDTEFGSAVSNAFIMSDGMGNDIQMSNGAKFAHSKGKRADDRELAMIPLYYTKKLAHPEQISSDLIGITCIYYNAALKFKNKMAIKDTCETIVDNIEKRKYNSSSFSSIKNMWKGAKNALGGKEDDSYKYRGGRDSNTWKAARKFLDMNLYNIRSDDNYGKCLAKLGKALRSAAVAINLGGNAAVAITGFTTLAWTDMVNAICGLHYGKGAFIKHPSKYIKSWVSNSDTNQSAGREVVFSLMKSLRHGSDVGYRLSNDTHMLLMEHYNITDQGTRKYKDSNRNRLLQAINQNKIYGMMTMFDYIAKSHVLEEVLMSYKLVDGEFMTKTDVILSHSNSSSEELKKAMKAYDEGITLRSIISAKGRKLVYKPEYKEAYDKVKNEVYSKIQQYCSAADGIPTDTQKAAITTTFIGSCILMHRQFLPLMIQKMFYKPTYNMDTQEWTEGTLWCVGKLLVMPLADAFTGRANLIKGFKNEYNLLKNNSTTDKNGIPAFVYKQAVKRVIVDFAMYYCVLSPIVSLVCAMADDKKNKDWLTLQFCAFLLRRLQWESMTSYRFTDMLNNFKSFTAATSVQDKFWSAIGSINATVAPQFSLYDTFFNPKNKDSNKYDPIVRKGAYKDWYKYQRDLFKLSCPWHNTYEQAFGSIDKRRYYENQIMQME